MLRCAGIIHTMTDDVKISELAQAVAALDQAMQEAQDEAEKHYVHMCAAMKKVDACKEMLKQLLKN